MTVRLHSGEREARELEQADHAALFATELAPEAKARPLPPIPVVAAGLPIVAPPFRTGGCHAGVRAARLATSLADLAAHPEIFRCHCGLMLDAPVWEWVPQNNDRGPRHSREERAAGLR